MKIDELTAQNLALEARVRELRHALIRLSDEFGLVGLPYEGVAPRIWAEAQEVIDQPTPDPSPLMAVVDAAVRVVPLYRYQQLTGVEKDLAKAVEALPDYMRRKEGTA